MCHNNFQNRTTALMWCVRTKNVALAQYLLSQGADPWLEDQNGNNVLFQIFEDTTWDEVNFLILWDCVRCHTRNIDVDRANKIGTSLMHLAVKREWVQAVIVLVEEKVSVSIGFFSEN